MPAAAGRKIPFNYTSADDRQVVALLLGELAAALSERPAGAGPAVLLTNCPACLQGLGRQARQGLTVQHLAVRLAEAVRADWQAELKALAAGAKVVTF